MAAVTRKEKGEDTSWLWVIEKAKEKEGKGRKEEEIEERHDDVLEATKWVPDLQDEGMEERCVPARRGGGCHHQSTCRTRSRKRSQLEAEFLFPSILLLFPCRAPLVSRFEWRGDATVGGWRRPRFDQGEGVLPRPRGGRQE